MDALSIIALHSIGHILGDGQLLYAAVEADDVMVARIMPASATLRGGVAVIRTDVVGCEIYTGT